MHPYDIPIPRNIRYALTAQLALRGMGRLHSALLIKHGPKTAPHRRIWRVEVGKNRRAFALKQEDTLRGARTSNAAAREAALHVPNVLTPVLFHPVPAFTLLPWIDAPPADAQIQTHDPAEILPPVLAWLGALHRAKPTTKRPWKPIGRFTRPEGDPLLEAAAQCMRGALARAGDQATFGLSHGDFHAHNILHSGTDFHIIDFQPRKDALPQLEDVQQFLLHLEFRQIQQKPPSTPETRAALRTRLLTAYGVPELETHPEAKALAFYVLLRMTEWITRNARESHKQARLEILRHMIRHRLDAWGAS